MLLRFGLPAAPPLGIKPVVPAELMVTDCFLPWSACAGGAPLTMVTPEGCEFCMDGLPFTVLVALEGDFPCCAEAGSESEGFLVAFAYDGDVLAFEAAGEA